MMWPRKCGPSVRHWSRAASAWYMNAPLRVPTISITRRPFDLSPAISFTRSAPTLVARRSPRKIVSSANLHDRADFDRSIARAGDLRGNGNRLIEVLRIDQVVAAELFLGFGKRAVGDERFAVADAHRGRSFSPLERVSSAILPGCLKILGELHVFAEDGLVFGRRNFAGLSLASINEQDVFHRFFSSTKFAILRLVDRRW